MNIKLTRNLIFAAVVSLVLFGFLVFKVQPKPVSDNDMSRLAGIISIVRFNEFNIDSSIYNNTGDRVIYDGQFYSSKPPVLHTVIGYVIKAAFQIKHALTQNNVPIYQVSTFLTTALPSFLIFWVFLFLIKNKKIKKIDIGLSLFLVFGTLLFSYSSYLNNHIPEALIQLLVFFFIVKKDLIQNKKYYYLLLGFLLSVLVVVDITFGFVSLPLTFIYLLITDRKQTLKHIKYFILGGLPLALLHFYLRYTQLNTLLPPQLNHEIYYNYQDEQWQGIYHGPGAQDHNSLIRFFNYTLGTHGLFLYQPVLLLPFFIKRFWKSTLFKYVASIAFGYILFNAVMQPDYFGSAFGPRRFLPLIPILFYFVAKYIKENWSRLTSPKKSLVILLLTLTLLISLLGYTNPWTNWDLYPKDNEKNVFFPLIFTIKELLGGFNSY